MHMIDKHMYPKNYFFAITKEGIDGRRSLLVEGGHRRRQSSTSAQAKESRRRGSLQGAADQQQQKKDSKGERAEKSNEGETATTASHEKPDTEMEDLTGAMSSLQFVPPSVRFGKQRAGFSKR
jgi:Mg-chelatase subunit ChlI